MGKMAWRLAVAVRVALVATVLVGLPVVASGGLPGSEPRVGKAPAAIVIDGIQFALRRGPNDTPQDVGTRFRFGPRQLWGFVDYGAGKKGDKLRWILRFGSTEVAFADLVLDKDRGRLALSLERRDHDYLMVGRFELIIVVNDNEAQRASFEIVDDSDGDHHDNSNRNGNSNNNNNGNANNNNNGNNNGNSNDNTNRNINGNGNDNN